MSFLEDTLYVIGAAILVILIICFTVILYGFIIMVLWNFIVQVLWSDAPTLDLIQAVALSLLCRLLFAGFPAK